MFGVFLCVMWCYENVIKKKHFFFRFQLNKDFKYCLLNKKTSKRDTFDCFDSAVITHFQRQLNKVWKFSFETFFSVLYLLRKKSNHGIPFFILIETNIVHCVPLPCHNKWNEMREKKSSYMSVILHEKL